MEPPEDSNAPAHLGLIPRWHHVDCFVKERSNLDVDSSVSADCFTGFSLLQKEDKDLLKKKIGVSKGAKGIKRKVEEEKKTPKKLKTEDDKAEEKALKVNKHFETCISFLVFYRLTDLLSKNSGAKAQLVLILG